MKMQIGIRGWAFCLLILFGMADVSAQEMLTLTQCREQALKANKEMLMAQEKQIQAKEMKRMALDQFFPTFSANGGYVWSQKEISLLSSEQQNNLNYLGSNIGNQIVADLGGGFIPHFIEGLPAVQRVEGRINEAGHEIVNNFKTDTRNICAGTISITQPVFLGGKVVALYDMASANAELQNLKYTKQENDLLREVDEYYWRVVSVEAKYKLAQQYAQLLDTLQHQVSDLLEVGVATQSDYLQVEVKRNEAQIALTTAENGLVLSKMALAQLCGYQLDKNFVLEESGLSVNNISADTAINMDKVLENRCEIKMLNQASRMAKDGVRVARSTFMPNIMAQGGYLFSNPNLYNGFSNTFGGMFYAGVVVNIPIVHPESFHALKIAKSKQKEANYQREEAKEKIELQVNQLSQRLKEAQKRYAQASSNMTSANENLRFAQEAYEVGTIGISDLMGAQTAWMQASSSQIDAEIDVKLCSLYLNQALAN